MTTHPTTLPVDAPLIKAAELMRDQGIGDVLVTKEGLLRGVVTDLERDPNSALSDISAAPPNG